MVSGSVMVAMVAMVIAGAASAAKTMFEGRGWVSGFADVSCSFMTDLLIAASSDSFSSAKISLASHRQRKLPTPSSQAG